MSTLPLVGSRRAKRYSFFEPEKLAVRLRGTFEHTSIAARPRQLIDVAAIKIEPGIQKQFEPFLALRIDKFSYSMTSLFVFNIATSVFIKINDKMIIGPAASYAANTDLEASALTHCVLLVFSKWEAARRIHRTKLNEPNSLNKTHRMIFECRVHAKGNFLQCSLSILRERSPNHLNI